MSFKGLVDNMLGCIISACGQQVLYQHACGGSIYSVNAVFDENFEFISADTEALVASNQPVIGIRLRDLRREPQENDEVIIDGRHFFVKDSQEDGQGGATLVLHFKYSDLERHKTSEFGKKKYP